MPVALVTIKPKTYDPTAVGVPASVAEVMPLPGTMQPLGILPSLTIWAIQVGVHPLHYGIILVLGMGFGTFMPPIGIGFYITCAVCETRLESAGRAMIPYLIVLWVGLLIVALVPWFTLYLPRMLHLG